MKNSFIFATALLIISCISISRVDVCASSNNTGVAPKLSTTKLNQTASNSNSAFLFSGLTTMSNYNFLTDRLKVIHPLLSEDNLRMVAFYLILKRDNRQGYFHSYKVSNTNIKCGQRSFDKYLKQCEVAGLIRKYKHSFALVSMHKLTEEEIYSTYDINFSNNIQQTVYELRKLIFRLHDRKQVYACNEAIKKNIPKNGGSNTVNVIETDCFKHASPYNKAIGLKRLGKLFGKSNMTAKRMIDLWINDNTLLKFKAPIQRIATHKSFEQYQSMVENNSTHTRLSYNNGNVFKNTPNIYSFNSNYTMNYIEPAQLPNTTVKLGNESCAYQSWDSFIQENAQWS